MLRYALLICLSARVQAKLAESDRINYHESLKGHNFEDYTISSDTFGDRDTFVVAQYQEDSSKFQVELALFYDKPFTLPKECSIILKGNSNIFAWRVTSLRRLSQTRVVLTWYSHVRNVKNPTTEIIVYDMNKCREIEMPLSFRKKLKNVIVVPQTEDEFDVVANDLQFCGQKFDNCWMHYNLARNTNVTHELKIGLDWTTVGAERLRNGDLKIEGSSIQNHSYPVFQIDQSFGNMTRKLALTNDKRIFYIASSEWSFCEIRNPDDRTIVDCIQVDVDKNQFIAKAVMFNEKVLVAQVRTICRDAFLLITRRLDCDDGKDCWNLLVTKVDKYIDGDKLVHKKLILPCNRNDHKLTILDVEWDQKSQRTSLHYACRKGKGFYFGFNHLFWDTKRVPEVNV